ncbi:MAG: DUF502 domain-containing protein [Chloroflexi bacterium]|nr:DUF502 domain-containing protein [Chloroflexota bacterium]
MSAEPVNPDSGETPSRHHRLGSLHGMAVHIQRTLGAGILVLLPIGVTVLILKSFFDLLDPVLQGPVLSRLPGPEIPGLGLLMLAVLVYFAGLVTTQVLGRSVVEFGHRVLEVIPVVKTIYGTTRSAVELLSKSNDLPYSRVVLVKFPHPGMQSIGLVTSRMLDADGEGMLAVYIPTTPIPSSGFLVLVKAEDVTPTDMTVEDAMKVVMSGGLLAEKEFQQLPGFKRDSTSSNQ